ncbi:Cystathionine gamma-lyase [Ignisphaera aggregans DSM 17230]|uniref:Cystathionine gamma-lyase n=1 Tax=Ignisphaera aggregans (strain DSM 17230 / JCM 13409 / AQ1.S1) TaxID=583356 RepID=E0SQ20_IGNAA|nr:Cystathionine gamma-lyase [Ignisphaera aggregans DSM 17230]
MAKLQTDAIHGHEFRDQYGSHIPPIYLSAIYEYIDYELGMAVFNDRGNYVRYGREDNPTTRALERILAKLELGEDALAFNSGMAAESALFLSQLNRDTKIVVPKEIYSSTFVLLENLASKIGFKVVRVWPSAESIVEAVDDKTAMVFIEVMTNPTNKVIDLDYLSKSIDLEKTILVVDNTFTTPVVLKPLRYKARFVLHSMTKYLGGHNDVVGGAIIGSKKDMLILWDWRRILGTILQPLDAYLVMRGIKTLEIRFERISKTAQTIAEYLSEHPRIEEVMYPGLTRNPYHDIAKKLFEKPLYGGVISFKIRGSYSDVLNFIRRLKIIKRAPSLGGTESLIVIPIKAGSMFVDPEDRQKLGITENLVRLSVGLEDPEDLIQDLSQALTS